MLPFPYVKALHIIFVITWFAGLFYIVRLFIYHIEAQQKPDTERIILQMQFKIMEKRLWYIITWPSAVLTLIFGIWMLVLNPALLSAGWMHMKLAFVLFLLLYHLRCHAIYQKLQKDEINQTSFGLRLWNEIATVLLVAIVFIVVLKDMFGLLWGLGGFLLFAGTLFLIARWYKKKRQKKE